MAKKPILDLDQLNPALFKFVGELRDIKVRSSEVTGVDGWGGEGKEGNQKRKID